MADFESAPSAFQLEDVVEILERRKWWIVAGAAIGLAIGAAMVFLLPAQFTATTTVVIEPQQVPENFIRSIVTEEVGHQVSYLEHRVTSFTNLSVLIDQVGAQRLDPNGRLTREELMEKVRDNLEVAVESGRSADPIFEVSYTAHEGELAAEMSRAIADMFISENIKDRTRQADATQEFLDRELDRVRQEVAEHEEQLGAFRQERMGSLPEQLDTNLRSLDRLNLELANNLEAQTAISQRIALLKRQDGTAAGGAGTDAAPGSLTAALRATRERLIEAQSTYTDEHPTVKHLKSEITRIESEIAAAPAGGDSGSSLITDPQVAAVRREVETAQIDLNSRIAREQSIRAELASLQEKVENTPIREQELVALTRDYTNLTETYQALLSKKYDAAIARNLEQAQKGQLFKMIRPARAPKQPTWPNPFIVLPGGTALGLAIVGIVIGIIEIRRPAFRSVNRLTRMIGLPVFASIPAIDNDTIYEVAPDGAVDPKLVVYTAPESAPAEQYRGFLPAFLEAENAKVILVTSATRGDGKSLTCMNIAISLAVDLGKRVLLIDSDMRRPNAHRLLRVPRTRGLSDILQGHAKLEECAIDSRIPNLSLVTAGPLADKPLTLIAGDSFLKLIDYARASYDIVVIDSPPLLPVVDTRILRTMADMIVFVVRADATPPQAALRSLQNLKGVAGVVFNCVSSGSFRRYYYYDAYSRYAYGDQSLAVGEEEAIEPPRS